MMFGSEDLVLLAVRDDEVKPVREFLADFRRGVRSPVPEVKRDTETVRVGDVDWDAQMVATLAERMPYDGVTGLIDHCAAEPGTWFAKSDIEEAIGVGAIQLRNELGALTKLTKKLFGSGSWPMEWKKEMGQFFYRLDPKIAKWWIDARGRS